MFKLNGIKFDIAKAQTVGSTQYPAGWFSSPSARAAIGLVEVADPVRPNDSVYIVSEQLDGTFAASPRPLAEVKAWKTYQLEQARDAAERAAVTVAGKVYPASESFQAKVSRTINQSGRGKPVAGAADAWRTADAQPVVMTPALLGLIEDAITSQGAVAWARFWQRFDAVQAASTNTEVDAVVW